MSRWDSRYREADDGPGTEEAEGGGSRGTAGTPGTPGTGTGSQKREMDPEISPLAEVSPSCPVSLAPCRCRESQELEMSPPERLG